MATDHDAQQADGDTDQSRQYGSGDDRTVWLPVDRRVLVIVFVAMIRHVNGRTNRLENNFVPNDLYVLALAFDLEFRKKNTKAIKTQR